MNLIIDIGNTQAKLVVFDGDSPVTELRTSNETLEALPLVLEQFSIRRAIVASVGAPSPTLDLMLGSLPFPTLRMTPSTPLPLIENHYRTPHTLGLDRLAAVVGAVSQKFGNDLLVVDAGTCVTYDFVDAQGCYLGGNISPGLHMRLQAMHEQTARLPLVEDEGDTPLLGYDTETALRSGAQHGLRHEIEGYIQSLKQKYPSLLVFLTGGGLPDFDSPIKSGIFADRFLVSRGLNRILQHNT